MLIVSIKQLLQTNKTSLDIRQLLQVYHMNTVMYAPHISFTKSKLTIHQHKIIVGNHSTYFRYPLTYSIMH